MKSRASGEQGPQLNFLGNPMSAFYKNRDRIDGVVVKRFLGKSSHKERMLLRVISLVPLKGPESSYGYFANLEISSVTCHTL